MKELAKRFIDKECVISSFDGNHQYEFVKKDLINYVPKIKKGGIIAGHDYGGNPHTIGTKRAIDEFFENPPLKVYKDTSWLYIKN